MFLPVTQPNVIVLVLLQNCSFTYEQCCNTARLHTSSVFPSKLKLNTDPEAEPYGIHFVVILYSMVHVPRELTSHQGHVPRNPLGLLISSDTVYKYCFEVCCKGQFYIGNCLGRYAYSMFT